MTIIKDDGTTQAPRKLIVGIDAGHGGSDPGVVRGELVEKDWTLEQAKRLEAALLEMPGVMPVLIRADDEHIGLGERGDLAAGLGVNLLIALHVNSNEDSRVNGMWAYHWPGNKRCELVGTSIEAAAPPEVRPRNPQSSEAKQDSWPRVRNVLGSYSCDAVLVEAGFATNLLDNAELRREDVKQAIVAACVAGVVKYLAP